MNRQSVVKEKEAAPVATKKEAETKEDKPYNEAPYYNENQVNVNEFHAKYKSFLEDDQENKKKQAEYLNEFMDNTGLSLAFKAICGEVLAKNVPSEDILPYTVGRLKELGKQIEKIKSGSVLHNTKESTSSNAPSKK